MSRGLIFWVMMLIWLVFGIINIAGVAGAYSHMVLVGGSFFEFVLFLLLGWQVYGPPVRG